MLVRPYPWQMANASQALGLLGTLFALGLLGFLTQAVWRSRGGIMDRAGPLVYVGMALLIAYALSVGNAGTGFRYRTHILAIGICLAVVLRYRRAEVTAPQPEPASTPAALVSAS